MCCLSAVSDLVKVTLWSRLIRNYNNLSHMTFLHNAFPVCQQHNLEGNKRDSRTNLWLFDSPHLLKNSAVVCAQPGYLTTYYPIRYASFTVQTKYESTTQLQLRDRDRVQPLLAVVLTNQCLFFSLWSVRTCLLRQQAFKITS